MPSRQRSSSSSAFLRIAAQDRPLLPPPKHPFKKSLILPISATALGLLAVLVLLLIYWYRKLLKQRSSKTSPDDAVKLHKFKYRQLKRATKSFSQAQKLGKGGFGVVYKGILRNGKEVAVKKLDLSSLQGEREFQNELSICGGLSSPYVVDLLGFCTHGRRVRLLVYECMQNRSLQEALFEKGYPVQLDWEKRFKIILDTAKAIAFLHLECSPPIIHGDVKPSNILLDSQFSARIADFGLARFKTEDMWMDSGRMSTSTDRLRSDTPDRFRPDTPDRFKPGTPETGTPDREMSRSSTRRATAEAMVKLRTEDLSEGKKQMEEKQVVIDIPPTEEPRDPEDVAEGDMVSRSPNFSHAPIQAGQSDGAPNDVTEITRPPVANGEIPGDAASPDKANGDKFLPDQKSPSPELKASRSVGATVAEHPDEWGKAYASEGFTTDEVVSGDRLKDSGLLALNSQPSLKKKVSGKDWWWRQDNSGELSVKDYVMDWIGSELRVSGRNGSCKHENHGEIVPVEENQAGPKRKEGERNKCKALGMRGELSGEIKSAETKKKEKKKGGKPKVRKSREWWKDEYFAELNSKTRSYGNGKGKRREKNKSVDNYWGKDYYNTHSGELSGCSGELKKFEYRSTRERVNSSNNRSREWLRDYHSGDLSLSRGRERRSSTRAPSIGGGSTEMWSGDLLNRQFSGDLLNRQFSGDLLNRQQQWSGDLSRSGELLSRDNSSTTSMRGTVCYVAPEYGGAGILSEKGDIYSFGVLMLVILSGRRPIQVTASPMKEFERANLISWARSLSQSGKLLDLMDEALHGCYDRQQATLCITLALLCLQRVPATRPNISDVVKILSGDSPAPALPLELSPSPPSRISYKSPIRPSSECLPTDTP